MVMRGPGCLEGLRVDAMPSTSTSPDLRRDGRGRAAGLRRCRLFPPLLADATQPWRQSFLIERRQLEEHFLGYAEQQGIGGDSSSATPIWTACGRRTELRRIRLRRA